MNLFELVLSLCANFQASVMKTYEDKQHTALLLLKIYKNKIKKDLSLFAQEITVKLKNICFRKSLLSCELHR